MSFLFALSLRYLRAGFRFGGTIVRAVWRWVLSDWRNGPLLMLALFSAFHQFLLDPRRAALTEEAIAGWEAEIAAHAATVANYREAARIAQQRAEANVARVEAEQAAITQEIVDGYQARIADARARAAAAEQRLRSATRTDPGRAGAAGVPGPGDAASGADPAAAQDRLPATRADAGTGLSLDDALIATEQAIQLDALIDWIEKQSSVEFSVRTPFGARNPRASAAGGQSPLRPCGPVCPDDSEVSVPDADN